MNRYLSSVRRVLSVSLLASLLFAAGCANQPTTAAEPSNMRIVVTHNGTYVVDGPKVTGYPVPGKALCADCTKAVEGYAATGKLDPMCASCKSPRTAMAYMPHR